MKDFSKIVRLGILVKVKLNFLGNSKEKNIWEGFHAMGAANAAGCNPGVYAIEIYHSIFDRAY
ncbi:hypothetical protein [Cyclobacterium jeungdonense]|uniref:Uncharacterized protein n=1 Tax=Cyclobacterium jeungdonense TaxID=708087 RepID=A0ABT8C4N5_9BACT|nr:hypothetical protein [Cyclobacterium jeungdonense]MDN3687347.1 hypothetical protein [Cyclobacterium jeungdonense]